MTEVTAVTAVTAETAETEAEPAAEPAVACPGTVCTETILRTTGDPNQFETPQIFMLFFLGCFHWFY